MKHWLREHWEILKDFLTSIVIIVPCVIIGNCLTPPEFLRIAIWKWILWHILG